MAKKSKKRAAAAVADAPVADVSEKTAPSKRLKAAPEATDNAVVEQHTEEATGVEGMPKKWVNKQRVLVFSSRGTSYRARHLLKDLQALLPHSKSDVKLDRKDHLDIVNEVCELRNCNNCIFLEARKKQDLYMWIAKTPHGPSAKFLVENVHTMDELKMTGNHLKGSRPVLSFDKNFDTEPHLKILKDLLLQVYGTPYYHPKSKPFFDHVLSFSVADGRIWFRNYQVVDTTTKKETETSLVEVGPRFCLQLIRLFNGSFGGSTLYENPEYESPNEVRRAAKFAKSTVYAQRKAAQEEYKERAKNFELPQDELEDIFDA